MAKASKRYLKVQGRQRVPKDPRLAKGSYCSKFDKGFIGDQYRQRVASGSRLAEGTKWSKVGNV